jgi:serine/threonine/tyrosine-interacting protein
MKLPVPERITDSCRSVCIRDVKEAFSVKPRFPNQFIYMVLDLEDNEEQNLIRIFPR